MTNIRPAEALEFWLDADAKADFAAGHFLPLDAVGEWLFGPVKETATSPPLFWINEEKKPNDRPELQII